VAANDPDIRRLITAINNLDKSVNAFIREVRALNQNFALYVVQVKAILEKIDDKQNGDKA